MREFGIWPADLEIRQVGGARLLAGTFRYGSTATIASRGSVRKERFGPRAFNFAIEQEPDRRIDLLVGHSFDRPIASRQAGTLTLVETDDAVTFEARLPDDPPSWVIDAEKAIAARLMTGVSPGFQVPPRAVLSNAEELIPEPGNPGVQIRQVNHAVLREFSVVTNAQYQDSTVELRAEDMGAVRPVQPTAATLWL